MGEEIGGRKKSGGSGIELRKTSVLPKTGPNWKLTSVAKLITELIRFVPDIRICHGRNLGVKGESVSVLRDSLPISRKSVSVTEIIFNLAARFCICKWKSSAL